MRKNFFCKIAANRCTAHAQYGVSFLLKWQDQESIQVQHIMQAAHTHSASVCHFRLIHSIKIGVQEKRAIDSLLHLH